MKNEILEFALSLADTAEAAIMPVFRHCTVSFKSDGTEVTDADKRDANYKVAIEKCDALAGAAKDACVSNAKAQYGKT